MTTRIIVTWRHAAFHRWRQSPRQPYLANLHRHLFHWRFEIRVEHNDREIEMHELLDACQSTQRALENDDCQSCNKITIEDSCETMAAKLLEEMQLIYQGRAMAAECWEDGECGARVELRSTLRPSLMQELEQGKDVY